MLIKYGGVQNSYNKLVFACRIRKYMDNRSNETKYALKARIFSAVTLVGSFGVAVALILSELMFAEIYELSECPLWYRIFLYVSLVVSFVGTVGCAVFKKTRDRELQRIYQKEQALSMTLMTIGLVMMLVAAFIEEESRYLDLVICVGGGVEAIGMFSFFGVAVGLARSKRKAHSYIELITELCDKNPFYDCKLAPPATEEELKRLERYLGDTVPVDLLRFYNEANGDGCLMLDVETAIKETERLRSEASENRPYLKEAFCFAKNDVGDYFCYVGIDGRIKSSVVYGITHDTFEIFPIVPSLTELIYGYYGEE